MIVYVHLVKEIFIITYINLCGAAVRNILAPIISQQNWAQYHRLTADLDWWGWQLLHMLSASPHHMGQRGWSSLAYAALRQAARLGPGSELIIPSELKHCIFFNTYFYWQRYRNLNQIHFINTWRNEFSGQVSEVPTKPSYLSFLIVMSALVWNDQFCIQCQTLQITNI